VRQKVYKEEKNYTVKKLYWMWRKGKTERGSYVDARKKFRELIEKVQKEKSKQEENELKNMKREAEI